ncbi:hypothetical protein NEOLEDRAFT_1082059 [Neolentinus lepideus HHB14362 ss-1]|uniref:Uncharacterized protein n=1 Tax=Neolentinus lepideus HHB14362 ss-1 TaxID=1314782 RepID=A0A165K651_9AGAM|nr:hypothetical protein NEOLEDRAFT_1082059 [Neolentinus lepideus HHB14362 ss-1]
MTYYSLPGHSQNVTTHCPPCQTVYSPDNDLQRYCPSCKRWWHTQCLQNITSCWSPAPLPGNRSSLLEYLVASPIVRGQNGKDESEIHYWEIVGSGVYLTMLQTTQDEAPMSEEWVERLDPSFAEEIHRQQEEVHFRCPECLYQV